MLIIATEFCYSLMIFSVATTNLSQNRYIVESQSKFFSSRSVFESPENNNLNKINNQKCKIGGVIPTAAELFFQSQSKEGFQRVLSMGGEESA